MEQNYLQKHETKAWAPKWQWFLQISSWLKSRCKSLVKVLLQKCYIDHKISLLHANRYLVDQFFLQENKHHLTIKFTAEISYQKLLSQTPLSIRMKDSTRSQFQHKNPLQTNRNIPVNTLYNVSPSGSNERLH